MRRAAHITYRDRLWATAAALLALLLYALTGAAGASVDVSATIDTTRAHVGDRITYTLTITSDPADSVTVPPSGVNLSAFRILEFTPFATEGRASNQITEGGTYIITAYQPGTYVIPPLPVEYVTADGHSGELVTRPLTVEIESVGVTPSDSLRAIKPPESVPLRLRDAIRYGLLGAVALLALIVYLVYRRRTRVSVETEQEVDVVVDEIAEFDRIPANDLIRNGEIRLQYFLVSEQLRRYITRRYAFGAMELTHSELEREMTRQGVPQSESEQLLDFLAECNRVKFAKFVPPDDQVVGLLDRAKDLVRATQFRNLAAVSDLSDHTGSDIPERGTP